MGQHAHREGHQNNEQTLPLVLTPNEWLLIARTLGLSLRESQICEALFEGKSKAQTAEFLGISRHTVHTHLERLYRKLNVHDKVQLAIRILSVLIQRARGAI